MACECACVCICVYEIVCACVSAHVCIGEENWPCSAGTVFGTWTADTALSTRETCLLHEELHWSHREVRAMIKHCSSSVSTSCSTNRTCLHSCRITWSAPRMHAKLKCCIKNTQCACYYKIRTDLPELIRPGTSTCHPPDRWLFWQKGLQTDTGTSLKQKLVQWQLLHSLPVENQLLSVMLFN